jgi:hypothetical protein
LRAIGVTPKKRAAVQPATLTASSLFKLGCAIGDDGGVIASEAVGRACNRLPSIGSVKLYDALRGRPETTGSPSTAMRSRQHRSLPTGERSGGTTVDLSSPHRINQFFPIYRRRFARQVDYWTLLFTPGVRAGLDPSAHTSSALFLSRPRGHPRVNPSRLAYVNEVPSAHCSRARGFDRENLAGRASLRRLPGHFVAGSNLKLITS